MTHEDVLRQGARQLWQQAIEAEMALDDVLRQGARQLLQQAIEAEMTDYIAQHQSERDEKGYRRVTRQTSRTNSLGD